MSFSGTSVVTRVKSWARTLKVLDVGFFLFAVYYAYLFWNSVYPYWFHPDWTTDDALQQTFPFHKVFHPEIFKNDLITTAMEGYLAPLHYWICYAVTWLCGDPVMMGHWVMLLQLAFAVIFIFLTVRYLAGCAPAFFAVTWLLHTRHIVQRLTGGLPRGWAAAVLSAYLYFLVRGNHGGVLITILLGCLLHPPGAFLAAVSYGLFLLWRIVRKETRLQYLKPFWRLVLISPLYLLVTFYVLKRPPEIGEMASYDVAASMPEFQYPKGRFPFIPLEDVGAEVKSFGFQAFIGRFYNPGRFWKHNMWWVVSIVTAAAALLAIRRRRFVAGAEFISFLIAIGLVYAASREFAFKLYVPNRHLQFPMAIFFIAFLSSVGWCAVHLGDCLPERGKSCIGCCGATFKKAWPSFLMILVFAALVFAGSNWNLRGAANFNTSMNNRGNLWPWIRQHTPATALFAGQPTHIDGVMLLGMRQGYVTTETAHPFYDKYYREVDRRLQLALRAHYAKNWDEFLKIVEPEKIDFFIFKVEDFYPENIKKATYFPPLDKLVKDIIEQNNGQFAFYQLPKKVNLKKYPFMPFRDSRSAVVEIAKLKQYLANAN